MIMKKNANYSTFYQDYIYHTLRLFVLRGHEVSNSLSVIFIFQYLNPVIKVIKDFRLSKYPSIL